MDMSLYANEKRGIEEMKLLKANMSLNLYNASKFEDSGACLNTPEMNMLMLGSPELERMLFASYGGVITTPTPTQAFCPSDSTTDDRGFLENVSNFNGGDKKVTDQQFLPVVVENVTVTDMGELFEPYPVSSSNYENYSSEYNTDSQSSFETEDMQLLKSKSAKGKTKLARFNPYGQRQNVALDLPTSSSPFDADIQEKMKLERKRERNRVAASKCRQRKLDRISELELQLEKYRASNAKLTQVASTLQREVAVLKQKTVEHIQSGCNVLLEYVR